MRRMSSSLVFLKTTTLNVGLFSGSRSFNTKTMRNMRDYLNENRGNIQFQQNESGFVRIKLPSSVYVPNDYEKKLTSNESLRVNYWYNPNAEHFVEESIHDHPNPFRSFIINGGYTHAYYTPIENPLLYFSKIQLLLKHLFFSDKDSTVKFQFCLDRAEHKVSYAGIRLLEKTKIENTKPGDIVVLDDKAIHKVCSYKPKALSINQVSRTGKGVTNLFISENKQSFVKTQRRFLSEPDALIATDEIISILNKTL